MAQEEFQVLVNINTGESVKNIKDLKGYIKELKSGLEGLDIGTEEYQKQLKELNTAQNALKGAMNATAASYEDVAQAANGMGESYNALVNRMAALRKAQRATSDEFEAGKIGMEIKEINDRLKDMDASIGNYQRNVGDYKNQVVGAFDKITTSLEQGGEATQQVINPLKKVKGQMDLIGKTPMIFALDLIIRALTFVVKHLGSSEKNMRSLAESFSAFNVIGEFTTKILNKIGEGIAWVAEAIGKQLDKMGLVSDAMKEQQELTRKENELIDIQREVQRKNADDMLEVAKIKALASDKMTNSAEERLIKLKEAVAIEEGIAARNVELAQKEYEILEQKKAMGDESTELANQIAEAYANMRSAEQGYFEKIQELNGQIEEATNAMNARFQEQISASMEASDEYLQSEIDDLMTIQDIADEEIAIKEEVLEAEKMQYEEKKNLRKADINDLFSVANATGSILGSIANMMESSGKVSSKQAKAIKGLRIAESTINTITGAIGAFTQASSTIAPPFGQIIGAVNAAAVTAMGIANIVKIKSTQVPNGTSGGSSATPSFTAPAAPSAPTPKIPRMAAPDIPNEFKTGANLTGLSSEDSLNVRAYIVSSDINAEQEMREKREMETSF